MQVGADIRRVAERVQTLSRRFDSLDRRFDRLEAKVDTLKEELIDGFRVVAEEMRHDFVGATKDQLADHERRPTQLKARPR